MTDTPGSPPDQLIKGSASTELAADRTLMATIRTARSISFGITMLAMGIWSHRNFAHDLVAERQRLIGLRLMNEAGRYRATPTFIVAALLLAMGLILLLSIAFRILD